MAKITYTNKEAINIDPSIPAKNKCMADDLNEIKNVVNDDTDTLKLSNDTWDDSFIYNICNVVCYKNRIYLRITTSQTFGTPPDEDTTNWLEVSYDYFNGGVKTLPYVSQSNNDLLIVENLTTGIYSYNGNNLIIKSDTNHTSTIEINHPCLLVIDTNVVSAYYIMCIGNKSITKYYYHGTPGFDEWETEKVNSDYIELIAVSSTAPSQCSKGDLYYNTSSNKIFTATGTNTWETYGKTPYTDRLYVLKKSNNFELYAYNGTTLISASASNEISISTTQPTGDEVLWINPDEVPTGQGSYISNEYGSSQEIGYSQEYVNNHFGKSLWTGSFTSGSINVPDLDKYKIIGIVADGVFCIGNKNFGGGIYGIYGGTGNGIVSYRLSNSGTTLSINSNDKGAYNNGTQVAITDIIGIM